MPPKRTMLALALLGAMMFPATAETSCSGSADIACTTDGAVHGIVDGDILSFRGIPYAKPPIGPLRWRPPEAPTPWTEMREATMFGPACPQYIGKDIQGAEDCLYVNVWRPRETPLKPLPVMIWLTGGGNHSYSGDMTTGFGGFAYEGSQLVPRGVVLVTYNLRLGPLGFLAHSSLDAERPEKISGNYGSLDQVAMLNWVHRNISAFGGDPDKVFLFGTSAGGGNICALMTAPATRGLIHGVAMQSSVPSGCEIPTLADMEQGAGRSLVKLLGCDAAPNVAACLRAKDYHDVIAALPGTFSVLPRLYGPNMDGHLFPRQPVDAIRAGASPPVPAIIGNTTGETGEWADSAGEVKDAATYAAAIEKVFGADAREPVMTLYPIASFRTPRDAFMHVTTDALFTCVSHRIAGLLAQTPGRPVYRYVFDRALENDPAQKARGAIHTVEHPFFFGWRGKYKPSEAELSVQRQLVGYWTRMAAKSDPNNDTDPRWLPVTPSQDTYLTIAETTRSASGFAGAHCDFWDKRPPRWPHM